MTNFQSLQELTAQELNTAFADVTPPDAPLLGGASGSPIAVQLGQGLSLSGNTLNAAIYEGEVIESIGDGLVLSPSGALSATQPTGFADIVAVETIAALRALTNSAVLVWVRGYRTRSDGGEGMFALRAGDTTTNDDGGIIIVTTGTQRYQRQTEGRIRWPLAWWGPHANNVDDDSATIVSALGMLTAFGGGELVLGPHSYRVNASFHVPAHCSLIGNEWAGGETASNDYSAVQFGLYLGAGVSVILDWQSALRGVSLINYVYFFPQSIRDAVNLLNGYNGTAVIVNGNDTVFEHCFVLGFAQLYNSTNWARCYVNHVNGDNLAGFLIDNCHDTGRILNCHFWNYMSGLEAWTIAAQPVAGIANNGGNFQLGFTQPHGFVTGELVSINGVVGTGYDTSGPGSPNGRYHLTVINSTQVVLNGSTFKGTYSSGGTVTILAGWARSGRAFSVTHSESFCLTNCQTFGYDSGFYFGEGAAWVTCVGCACDNYLPVEDTATVGVWFDSTAYGCSMIGGFTSSYGTPIYSSADGTEANFLTSFYATNNGAGSNLVLNHASGKLIFNGSVLNPGPNNAVIDIFDAVTLCIFNGCEINVAAINYQTSYGTGQQHTIVDGKAFGGAQGSLGAIFVGGAPQVALRCQAGAPGYAALQGSIHIRSDGGNGTTLYVNGNGTSGGWRAFA